MSGITGISAYPYGSFSSYPAISTSTASTGGSFVDPLTSPVTAPTVFLPTYFPNGSSVIPGYSPSLQAGPPPVSASPASLLARLLPADSFSGIAGEWGLVDQTGLTSGELGYMQGLNGGSSGSSDQPSLSDVLTAELQADPALQTGMAGTLNNAWLLQNSLNSYQNVMSLSSTMDALGSSISAYL